MLIIHDSLLLLSEARHTGYKLTFFTTGPSVYHCSRNHFLLFCLKKVFKMYPNEERRRWVASPKDPDSETVRWAFSVTSGGPSESVVMKTNFKKSAKIINQRDPISHWHSVLNVRIKGAVSIDFVSTKMNSPTQLWPLTFFSVRSYFPC